MTVSYFDVKRENELIASGTHFWCEGCLYARPVDDRSPDPRYCQSCYGVLSHEASLLSAGKHPAWVPRTPKPSSAVKSGSKTTPKNQYHIPQDVVLNMSTLNDQKSKVDIIQPVPPKVTREKRGPKTTELPDDLIRQWASEGVGSKAISTRLRAEGFFVSYKTIQRRLQGVLVLPKS